MNTSQHLKQQLLYSYNAEQTVVFPIDWKNLLHTNRPPQSPQAVREYLNNVIERMNQHFAVVMHGPMTGKIMVTRESRAPDAQPESIFVSVWRARSLFPRKIQLRWAENGQSRTLFKPALDVWLRSSARREIIPGAVKSPAHPVVKWLRALLSPPDVSANARTVAGKAILAIVVQNCASEPSRQVFARQAAWSRLCVPSKSRRNVAKLEPIRAPVGPRLRDVLMPIRLRWGFTKLWSTIRATCQLRRSKIFADNACQICCSSTPRIPIADQDSQPWPQHVQNAPVVRIASVKR